MVRLYLDMDGVVADLKSGYSQIFGIPAQDDIDWDFVNRECPDFFSRLPPMPDFPELWAYVKRYDPIILTGVPKASRVPFAVENKVAMVRRLTGDEIEVRCCHASQKYLHCRPGDIIIDDWDRYKNRWIKAGGIWITHTSAANSIECLRAVMSL